MKGDPDADETLHMSPPLAYEVRSGYRVGETLEETYDGLTTALVDIIENSTGRDIAMAQADTKEEAESIAQMIVACLNREPR